MHTHKHKISKEEANYVARAKGGKQQCQDCDMYLKRGACTLVLGKIAPGGHCKYWEAKNKLPTK